jgi:hypothetical protein
MEPTTDLRQGVARATLEIETEGRSPGGVLITAQGRELAFSGWAEFGAVIEDWRRGSAGATGRVRERGGAITTLLLTRSTSPVPMCPPA